MHDYLNRPFPFIEQKKQRVVVAFLFALFVYLFLMVFQPFGLSSIVFYKAIYISGFFFITFFILLIGFLLGPLVFKSFFSLDKWTIKKNIIFHFALILVIITLNWWYNSTVGHEIVVQHNFFYFIFITASIGIFPILFFMYFLERKLTIDNQSIATEVARDIQEQILEVENSRVHLVSKNKDESFDIDLSQLICVKSEGNYLKVFYMREEEVVTKLIRNSILSLEKQFSAMKSLKRCHRSFIVNLDRVEKVSGNARSLNFHIPNLDFTIPVSRNFPKEILEGMVLK